jgi:hypothetical protein
MEKTLARVDDYRESFRLAAEQLQQRNVHRMGSLAGAQVSVDGMGTAEVRLDFLGSRYLVRVGSLGAEVNQEGRAEEVPLPEKILLAHYLLTASGEPESGELITFRQIPDGQFYDDAFQRRTRDPLLACFGADLDLFRACAERLGGMPVEAGDCGMLFLVLPRVPVRLVLWRGDDEFAPEAGVLFDSSIRGYLPVEDIAVLSGMLVYRLMGLARGMSSRS